MSLRRRTLGSVLRFIGSICTSSTLSWDSFLHSQLGDQGPSTLCATPSLTSVDSTSGVWSRLGAAARLRENPEQKYPPLVVRRNVRERSAPGRGTEAGAGGGACLVETRHPPVFLVLFVSRRCSRGSRPSSHFAPFPGSLCVPQARRHRRPPLCPSLLRKELSGTAFPRCWACRSSGTPCPGSGTFKFNFSPASWGPCYDP